MSASEAKEPTTRMPTTFQEAVALWQRCMKKGDEMDQRRQVQVGRQKEIIERQRDEILRMRALCDSAGISWREDLGL